jgi:hypothetical protein
MSVRRLRWQRRADVPWRRSLDTVVIFPPNAPDAVMLAATGPEIWDLLERATPFDVLVDVLTDAYGADRATVEAEVRPVLERLAELGAIENVDD